MLRSALEDYAGLRLRLRLHPRLYVRTKPAEREELYGWLATDQISDPAEVDLLDDIVASELAITVWSTTALDTMRAGVPLIWLVPERLSAAAKSDPLYLRGTPGFDRENCAGIAPAGCAPPQQQKRETAGS